MISRCLLIAKRKETRLHVTGECQACASSHSEVMLQRVAAVNKSSLSCESNYISTILVG